jgi:hypothetical protein
MKLQDGYKVLMTHRSKYVAATGTIRLLPNEVNYVMIDWDVGVSSRVDVNYFTYDWIYVVKDEKEALATILKLDG